VVVVVVVEVVVVVVVVEELCLRSKTRKRLQTNEAKSKRRRAPAAWN